MRNFVRTYDFQTSTNVRAEDVEEALTRIFDNCANNLFWDEKVGPVMDHDGEVVAINLRFRPLAFDD